MLTANCSNFRAGGLARSTSVAGVIRLAMAWLTSSAARTTPGSVLPPACRSAAGTSRALIVIAFVVVKPSITAVAQIPRAVAYQALEVGEVMSYSLFPVRERLLTLSPVGVNKFAYVFETGIERHLRMISETFKALLPDVLMDHFDMGEELVFAGADERFLAIASAQNAMPTG